MMTISLWSYSITYLVRDSMKHFYSYEVIFWDKHEIHERDIYSSQLNLGSFLLAHLFFLGWGGWGWVLGIEPKGTLSLSYISSPLFFYFESGSYWMAEADHNLVILPQLPKWLGFTGVATMPGLVIYEIKVSLRYLNVSPLWGHLDQQMKHRHKPNSLEYHCGQNSYHNPHLQMKLLWNSHSSVTWSPVESNSLPLFPGKRRHLSITRLKDYTTKMKTCVLSLCYLKSGKWETVFATELKANHYF